MLRELGQPQLKDSTGVAKKATKKEARCTTRLFNGKGNMEAGRNETLGAESWENKIKKWDAVRKSGREAGKRSWGSLGYLYRKRETMPYPSSSSKKVLRHVARVFLEPGCRAQQLNTKKSTTLLLRDNASWWEKMRHP